MILTHFSYGTVKITYDEPVDDFNFHTQKMGSRKEETWKDAQVFFDRKGDYATLRVARGDKSILLGRAKVLELSPWGAKFEAYWWKGHDVAYKKDGKPAKRQKNGFARLVRADIVCEV